MKSNGFHLFTFGGLRLTRGDIEIRGAGARRKPLALLAFLAVNARGVSRDKVAVVLWPEADAESARTTLRQTLYSLRRDLDAPTLVLGNTELRLNPEVIDSDWARLEDAIEDDDLETASSVYAGPFLDGFHLPDSTEFERWLDAERARCDARVRAAVETLALRAVGESKTSDAVRWWTRLTELDPLSGSAALGLMRALADAGDSARAIRHAEAYARYVENEIGSAPDARILTLAGSLREAPVRSTPPSQPALPPVVLEAPPATSIEVGRSAAADIALRRFRFAAITAAALVVAATTIALVSRTLSPHTGPTVAQDDRLRVSAVVWRVSADGRDSVVASASVEGESSELRQLLDRLTASLLTTRQVTTR